MEYLHEPERKTKIKGKYDLCVIGGSCTGVFAAVRAARLGLSVAIIERHNILGGTAVTGLVNIWHSIHDTDGNEQIIAGLTYETLTLLKHRDALVCSPDPTLAYNFNPFDLAQILDNYIRKNKITLMLHTSYSAMITDEKTIKAIIIEDNDGRSAIEADFFIDATGDGRLARDFGIPSYTSSAIQPPTACFYLQGDTNGVDLGKLVREHGAEFGLDDDWGWSTTLANAKGITMRADNHVFDLRLDRADDLTTAELEGRRRADAFVSMLRLYGKPDEKYRIVGLCSHIGTRETVHYDTLFRATACDLLHGKRYDHPILKGTYRVDIHHAHDHAITFQYLDGKETTVYGKGTRTVSSNWRDREGITSAPAKYYELPLDVLIPKNADNLIPVGRMLNADDGAFGALRVMVNLNQLGEAAGVAAYHAINSGSPLFKVDAISVANTLRAGGSAL